MPVVKMQFPPSISVRNLNGVNGFNITRFPIGSDGGFSVSGAGDVNGDGIADLIIGANGAFADTGASYVLFGKSGLGSSGSVSVSNLTGSSGFIITGFPASSYGGWSVSGAGDVNGDGIADLIIGAPYAGAGSGACYVLFGKSGLGSSGSVSVSSLTGSNGFVITGFPANSWGGLSVSGAGDVNGDGVADLIIGAPHAYGATGASYVLFGKSGLGSLGSMHISSFTGNNGFNITGFPTNSLGGNSVSGAGDVNGDGIADLIIGAYNAYSDAGASYLIFGKSGLGSSGTMSVASLTGSNGFAIMGFPANGFGGNSVSGAGDVNGDGVADLIIGAPDVSGNVGVSYVLFGQPGIGSSGSVSVSSLIGSNGFNITGSAGNYIGYSVSCAGDVNGDGIDDLLVGAPYAFGFTGVSYVLFGKLGIGSSGGIDASILTDSNGFAIRFPPNSRGGSSVSGAGDVNGDGVTDLIIGAPGASSAAGAIYVVFGEPCTLIMSRNQLAIKENQTLLLSSQNFNATNPENSSKDSMLQFTLSGIQHGRFYSLTNTSLSLMSFTQQQVRGGQIYFAQDGSGLAPSFNVSVGYSGFFTVSSPQMAAITFQQSFVLVNNNLTINQGQIVILTSGYLSANDLYNTANNPNLVFSISNIQHGFFALTTAPATPKTSFTQAEVQSGKIQFVHDGSVNPPSYSVTLINGATSIAAQFATISFDAIPIFINNNLIVNEGQTAILTINNFNATNPYNPSASLTFSVSGVQHGYFALTSAPNNPVTSFSQLQVRSGFVHFVQDGTSRAPGYNATVSDGRTTSAIQAGAISFDILPTLVTNTLTINQGQTVVLSLSNLSASDPYTSSFTFTVSNFQHGYFALTSAPTTSIMTFTQAQIQSGDVQFVQDGSVNPPSYSVSVSDGRMTSAVQAATISFDVPPTLVTNNLTINQGQTVVLSLSNLSATDPYTSSFNFTVSSVLHGYFALVSVPTTPITIFTQAQIQSGNVQFVQDGSINSPSYSVSVSDGRMTSAVQAATISFDVPPALVTNTLMINQGQTVVLSLSNLSASDPYTSSFTFTVSNILHGYFALMSVPTTSITTFTQAQIQSGAVEFVHDGSVNPPSYDVIVSDGRMASGTQAATISFDVSPILMTNTLTINQGQTIVLTLSNLSASDPYTSSFTFIVSNVQHGYFALMSTPTTPITTFTQAQIQSGNLQFVQDGSANPPSYDVTVSDGRMSSSLQAAIISFDAIPIINTNSISINQGQTIVLSLSDLSATNPYNSGVVLTFTASNVQHGYFALTSVPATPITSFTQAQIQSSDIQFSHDGSIFPPGYSVTVTDGRTSSAVSAAAISFDRPPVLITNRLTVNQAQSIILTSTDISATDPDNPADSLIFIVSNVQHGYFAFMSDLTTPITSFTQEEIQRLNVQFVTDGGVAAPSYDVAVTDGRITTAPQAASISFDAMPVFIKNQLIINQGQTVVLSSQYLSARNPYNPAANLIFTVSDVQHGIFSVVNTTTPIISFTPAQIQSGRIQFIADGSSNQPSFAVTVSDGRMTSLPQASVIFFDATFSSMQLNQGQTVVLSTANFNATLPRTLPSNFIFLVKETQSGYFAENQQPLIKIANFTQLQLQNNRILFVSDGSAEPPSYQLAVSYNGITSIPRVGYVQFNAAPILQNNYLRINQGQTKLISSVFLSASDLDDPVDSLVFMVSNMQYGQFELLTAPSVPLMHFTQGQIQSGQIQFVTDGSARIPSYYVAVSDRKILTDDQQSVVIFDAPTLIKNRLFISQGQTVKLSAGELSATGLRNIAATLSFNISQIHHAYFSHVFNPLSAITYFTQAEINQQIIQVTHDGSTIAPSYQVSVTDGTSTTPPQTSEIDFNTSPIWINNWLPVMQGQPTIISASYLNATDIDKDKLTFSVSNIQQGYFAIASAMDQPITSFTQSQVTAAKIAFVPDGSSLAPSYQITVSDGYTQTFPSKAAISFEFTQAVQSSSSATQTVTSKIIGGTASGAAALLFFGFQLWLRQKTVKNLQNAMDQTGDVAIRPIAKKVFERLDRLGFLGYCSAENAVAYVYAIGNIVDRLKKLGVVGDLSQESVRERILFGNEIAKQVKMIARKEYSYCSTGFVSSFFKAEVTPEELRANTNEIVAAVQQELAPQSKQSSHLNRVYYSRMTLD